MKKINVLIPCGGLGTRLAAKANGLPKPLIKVKGKTLIEHSISSFNIEANFIFVTRKFDKPQHNQLLSKLLKSLRPESEEVIIDKVTSGAAETALAAKNYINNENPLIIYNCDQIFNWEPKDFITWLEQRSPDAAIVLYESTDPKNSFALVEDGVVKNIKEKTVISNNALVGFHYWSKGSDFIRSAELLLENFHSDGAPECYLSETYNYLENSLIKPYFIASHQYIPLGTLEDISRFIGKSNEFNINKPATLLIDLDGTIIKHKHAISLVHASEAEQLKGVRDKLDEWDSIGHKIIIITARKESERQITVKQLQKLAIPYDFLIMGVTSGPRIIINDKINPEADNRATAVNVITDKGFESINWEEFGL